MWTHVQGTADTEANSRDATVTYGFEKRVMRTAGT
jgi:hypothetical protein